ncbi:25-hydroxycholesterol 7-alpha-hydroxylase [Colletotrichum spinosum]|uniref:25-hydroxycholesterol 7-alpha-hydroxylase n=1 Tax=Colletotrichum spinosum TaxID=1347390 RepID=A0A4R8PN68_9PEZI|nr:25-hydroxycholesterol 7-alpha-hydroxylase [Colletotrichum spinosum]
MAPDLLGFGLPTYALGSVIAVLLAIFFWIQHKSNLVLDPREPPLLDPRVPIIGHVLRMWRDGGGYYVDIHRRLGAKAQAVTLNILGQKLYVLLSPSNVQAAFRNRNLTSERFNVQAATGVVGLSARAKHLLEHSNLLQDFYRNMPLAMAPEPLRNMTMTALKTLSADLNELAAYSCGNGHEPLDLYGFLRDRLVLATTDGLYGNKTNPVRAKPGLVEDVWTFDEAMFTLFFNIAPKLTAPAGHKARGRLQEVLIAYFREHPDDLSFPADAAELTRMRARLLRKYGMTDVDVGNIEIGMIHAAVANTAPILFWMVVNIFSRPEVLANLRLEVEKLVEKTTDGTATLRASQLTDRNLCPYVAAVNREVMRLCDSVTGTRFVDEDVTLPDGTLLKAGALVHMPSAVAHRMADAWGPHDAEEFNPERSLGHIAENGNPNKVTFTEPSSQRRAFWPFGGGKHLCPGRHFAFAENVTFVSALAVGFEVQGLDVDSIPPCGYANLTGQSVPKPRQAARVTFRRRRGWENVTWRLIA